MGKVPVLFEAAIDGTVNTMSGLFRKTVTQVFPCEYTYDGYGFMCIRHMGIRRCVYIDGQRVLW